VRVYDFQQGSDKWHQVRSGVITASMFNAARSFKRSGESTGLRLDYAMSIVLEQIMGKSLDSEFETWHMKRGRELESQARAVHSLNIEKIIHEIGFVTDESGVYGCSPDGLIDKDGGAEYKCPVGSKQIRKVFINLDPSDYLDQVQGNMWITDRKWWHLVIYCPFLASIGRSFTLLRYQRDDAYIEDLVDDLEDFDELVGEYRETIECDELMAVA